MVQLLSNYFSLRAQQNKKIETKCLLKRYFECDQLLNLCVVSKVVISEILSSTNLVSEGLEIHCKLLLSVEESCLQPRSQRFKTLQ